MISETRPWVAYFLSAAALIVIWTFGFNVHDQVVTLIYGQEPNQLRLETSFVRQAVEVEFPTPIDYAPIQAICARTSFQPGLLFSCDGQHGGIGMVRNQILKCIRYAIHGGGAVVIPTMALRSANDLAEILTFTEEPLDYLMDRAAFVEHLSGGCPGMRIYEKAEDFPFYGQRVGEPLTVIGDQFEPNHPREGLQNPGAWRRFFDDWLVQQKVQPRTEAPVHVMMGQSYLEYPVHDDGDAFANEFGKILSFRHDTRALAAKVLYELHRRYVPTIDPATPINQNAFYGAHLRLEEDAVWAWSPDEWRFSRMKDQFEEQFRNIVRTGLQIVYVASGNQTVTEMFTQRLHSYVAAHVGSGKAKQVTVVTKHDLLKGLDRKLLDSMTFDQLALVDFLVLFKSSAFMGVAHSSFSWNVALRRHELSKYTAYGNEGSDLLRDEYSVIMGMEADYPHVDPFMYAIWP